MDFHAFFQTFSPIEKEIVANLLSKGKVRTYKKGEIITAEGEIQREILFVEEGVQMSYLNKEGNLHIIAFTYPPSLSGIPESFLFQTPSKYHLEAVTNSRFIAISYETLAQFFENSQALERVFRKITEHLLVGIINRHLDLQTLTIEERFKTFAQRSPHLFQLVPHKYIASYLHISPTNFSKLYNSIKIA